MSHTVLTVFENTDTINEPVVSFPMVGRMSFRQLGILIGLSVMLPMMIYSSGSEYIADLFPDPVFSFDAVNGQIKITWDVLISLVPMPIGLVLGMPRPKLVPMDRLIIILVRFAIHHTSISAQKKPRQVPAKSRYAGFAKQDESISAKPEKNIHCVSVTEFGLPKNITVTIYDTDGNPMRHRLARAYIDDRMLCSITTDADGMMGMTFVPEREGQHNLRITVQGTDGPVVDVTLDVRRQ